MSRRSLSRLTAFTGVASAIALVGHFAVAPPPTSFTSRALLEQFASHHDALLTGAWLDGIGSVLLIVTFLGVVELGGLAGTLAGRIVLLGGAGIVAHSMFTDSLLVASAQISAAGDGAMAASVVQVIHAADYAYPMVNVFWAAALGVVVLRSRVLPAVFGYVALAFGAVELVGGLASLYSDAVNAVINPFFMVMVLWNVGAAITLAVRSFEADAQPVSESRLRATGA
jgi:hypothetical protein